jgi:phospholipid transport system transporter-binding protein
VQGPVTIDNVLAVTQQGTALFDSKPYWTVDLNEITDVDSTVISMLLEWRRIARRKNCRLQFVNLPASLKSLIQLYGIVELIPVSENQTATHDIS